MVNTLQKWGLGELADTAALLTSEVVTNAVLHARTAVALLVRRLDDGVAVEVSDGSPNLPRSRRATPQSTTGRGMALLDRLAESWDVSPTTRGKTVRFTLRDDADPWAAFTGEGWEVEA